VAHRASKEWQACADARRKTPAEMFYAGKTCLWFIGKRQDLPITAKIFRTNPQPMVGTCLARTPSEQDGRRYDGVTTIDVAT
jgi:hypothetical protein